MSKLMEDFENFAESRGFDKYYYFSRGVHPNYYDHDTINEMWLSWQAAQKSLIIELPRCWNDEQRDYRDELVEILENAGVNYK